MDAWIRELTGATRVAGREHVQLLWSGYGEIVRVRLEGADVLSVISKQVSPGGGRGRSHERKLRSYDVERAFYRDHAARCPSRVARCLAAERTDEGWRFLLEDLDAAGYSARRASLSVVEVQRCLAWLARFHAAFVGVAPDALWEEGTYWHLATRPDELAVIADARLRDAAPILDGALRRARFRTFVHGDAKPANFCFTPDGAAVAAVDFQYVGGGCGMRDVAYLLFARRGWGTSDSGSAPLLDDYFAALRASLDPAVDADALEAEWRALYPVARADFHRFLAGWSPSEESVRGYRDALEAIPL
ncbi:MAG: ecdysteroid 22-kinase family protein [Myxococcota bacterium]|nr:ecdysteroid 22-kinase family protein [Myxococcota bacterium]